MFKCGIWHHWFLLISLGLFLGGNGLAKADLALGQWDQGLNLLDEGRPSAAAEHFYNLFEQQPHRLDLLEGCFRAENYRSHADSVQAIVENRVVSVLSPGSLGRRYLSAKALRGQNQFSAAADSFQELARTCRLQNDYLSALTATKMVCRCQFDIMDHTLLRNSRQLITEQSRLLPHHPRLQLETNIIIDF